MRNLWISNLLLVFLAPLAFAQINISQPEETKETQAEEREASEEAPALTPEQMKQGRQVEDIVRSLRAFQPDETLDHIKKSDLPEGLKSFFRGWSYHQKGDYKQAAKHLGTVNKEDFGGGYYVNRLEELLRTAEELKDFTVVETENFSIRYREGRDKVMLFFLPDMLEQIYARYSALFDYQRDEKIIVELMPNHQLFSYASALTRKQIETTGTIALCVENRLVALTPRRVAAGYYWPDVIAHEFVHYILTKLSRDRVPLWMQEGVAKYFESRWDPEGAPPLDSSMETSLALALEKDNALLTVEQMMPSFAALPTAGLARQAYAQTTTMIDYLCQEKGEETLRGIFVGLRDQDGDMDAVMQDFLGKDFETFEGDWREWLAQQGYRKHALIEEWGVKLLDEDSSEEKVAALDAEDKRQKKHVRLGDLLLERNRYRGALKEYTKILPDTGSVSRQVVLRMITCHRQLSEHEEVISFIDKHVPALESDTTMLLHKAEAQVALSRNGEALPLLQRALRYNPFNAGIYRLLTSMEEGDTEQLKKYREALKILTNPVPPARPERKS